MPSQLNDEVCALLDLVENAADAYMLRRMIAAVGWRFDPNHWDRKDLDPGDSEFAIDENRLRLAIPHLRNLDWISVQRVGNEPVVRSLKPLAWLKNLRGVAISHNEVQDLAPLSGLPIRRLHLNSNKITDMSPLIGCRSLRELSIRGNPWTSLAPLSEIKTLEELELEAGQIHALAECAPLSSLVYLEVVGSASSWTCSQLPAMPKLSYLHADGIADLDGLEKFGTLQNIDLDGDFPSLTPLQDLKQLTHIRVKADLARAIDLKPLARLFALRSISVNGEKPLNVDDLESLPALREFNLYPRIEPLPTDIASLINQLSSWDNEFLRNSTTQAGLKLVIVDQATFDRFDTHEPFGIHPGETNKEMVLSERDWLMDRIKSSLSADFEEEDDFVCSWKGGFRRSGTVVLHSIKALNNFTEISHRIQQVLCSTVNEWIIYLQSDCWEAAADSEDAPPNFICWLYRDKIMTTEEYREAVTRLLASE